MLPLDPLDPGSDWACDKCGRRMAAEDQQQTLCQALEVSMQSYEYENTPLA